VLGVFATTKKNELKRKKWYVVSTSPARPPPRPPSFRSASALVRRGHLGDLTSAPAVRDSAASASAAPLHHTASTPSRIAPPPRLPPSTNQSHRLRPGFLLGAPHEAPAPATPVLTSPLHSLTNQSLGTAALLIATQYLRAAAATQYLHVAAALQSLRLHLQPTPRVTERPFSNPTPTCSFWSRMRQRPRRR
jgi:hypothetical protein